MKQLYKKIFSFERYFQMNFEVEKIKNEMNLYINKNNELQL